jgi:hypothetical protein
MQTPSQSKLKQRKRRTRVKAVLWIISAVVAVLMAVVASRMLRHVVVELAMSTPTWTCTSVQIVAGPELTCDSVFSLSGCELNKPLASYSTTAIKERLLLSPWIKSAHIERRPPNTLIIHIVERKGIAILRDGTDLAVSDDLVLLPAADKPWKNALPWLSANLPFARQIGPMSERDPLHPVAKEFARVRQISPELADNMAEMYRLDGNWGVVIMNPVLTVMIAANITSENWHALGMLLGDASFQDRLDSNAVVDLRLPGFVTLQLPEIQAEETQQL